MKNSPAFISSLRNELIGSGLILLVWSLVSLAYPMYIIPSPVEVIEGAIKNPPQDFAHHAFITLFRVAVGFVLSLVVGTFLGSAAYIKKWGGQLNALMLSLQVLPGTVLGVIFLLVFGLGSAAPILLITFMVLPTLAVNTYNGLFSANKQLEEYLMTLGSKKSNLFKLVYLPVLVPVLQSNLTLGFSLGVKVVVLGEFIGSQDGLGYLLNTARIFLNMQEVFLYVAVLMAFTLAFQAAASLLFSTFFRNYFFAS